ncbi:MAG: FixH family protein [Saprospiraceae bacterium]
MNWEWIIAILYGSFVTMMVTLVVLSSQQDIPLVTEDYYEKDLQYETQMQRIANSKELNEDVSVKYDAKTQQIKVQFPKEMSGIEGEILCFRPSQEGIDFTLSLDDLEENATTFGTSEMLNGRWKIKITWEGDGEIYYKESTIYI